MKRLGVMLASVFLTLAIQTKDSECCGGLLSPLFCALTITTVFEMTGRKE